MTKRLIIFSFLLFTLVGCKNELAEFCENRDPFEDRVVLALYNTYRSEHVKLGENQFVINERIIFSGKYSPGGTSPKYYVNDEEYDDSKGIRFPVGTHVGRMEQARCEIEVEDDKYCPCKDEELRDVFTFEVFDTKRILIDSIRWSGEFECMNWNACPELEVRVEETGFSKKSSSNDFQSGLELDYSFRSVPRGSIATLIIDNLDRDSKTYEFDSEMTSNWTSGWHSSTDGELEIFVR